jgi:hypothetical protein
MDPMKVEPGLCSETCPVSSHGESQDIDIKEEEYPEPITFSVIKSENEVSCVLAHVGGHVKVCVPTFQHFINV